MRADIGDCTRCKLHALGRRQIVFGVGNPNADLMFVGEAPGADEDIQGVPFVGRAGQLLTKIIEAIGLTRDDVYIANVIKCRPPENRNPEPDEVETCEPFLFRQIDVIKPKVIVALGKFAAQTLLRTIDPISRLRGRVFDYRGAKLIPTFHPAYLLRNPSVEARGVGRHEAGPRDFCAVCDSSLIRVAVPVPALDLLTYRVPDGMAAAARRRARRRAARHRAPSPALSSTARCDARRGVRTPRTIKPIREVLDDEAFLPADVVALARWTAEYYAAGPGDAITAVLPPKTRGERADAHKTVRVASITAAGLDGDRTRR